MIAQPAECERTPAAEVRPVNVAESLTTPHLRDASRMIATAYPGLTLYYDSGRNTLYVIDAGVAYEAIVKFERDDASGYAALALSYASRHAAAVRTGTSLTGTSCRSSVELVVARMGASGDPTIVARSLMDDEAIAVDVRTLGVGRDFDRTVGVQLFYHAYYGAAGWFGHVTFRSEVALSGSRLVTHRRPAAYVKLSNPGRREQQGMLGPGGQRREGWLVIMAASFDEGTYTEIEVPIVGAGSMSGAQILQRVP